ncbi:MAG: DUF4080 domain-containing protein [Ruminococcaceae bacterium]|nr:DUF4080 domain-containing protein [Oscillospiraceae bacterium]
MLLVGINAKYIHSNLAIRYLSKADSRCSFREYTIADRAESIAADLYTSGRRTFLFSCYIWNIELVLRICEILKKADSGCVLALGGPEVSFDAEGHLKSHPQIDFVLSGEGEPAITPFLDALASGDFHAVPGLYYRAAGEVQKSAEPAREADMPSLPFPYDEADPVFTEGRIIYYETSRGCPYRCAFCLSGAAGSLRFLPVSRVMREIDFFVSHGVPLVKLVDRTFNADPDRALRIIEYIKERGGDTTFHFEIRAESMTEALIKSLQEAPKGMFQLEIGVQSVNADTLERVNRRANIARLQEVVRALLKNDNIHLHLDLIAGLPGESFAAFLHSFHTLMALRPHNLQLGFLKKLKGSNLAAPGSKFSNFPPYEVISSNAMSYAELLRLAAAEDMLEKYYNSGAFSRSVSYILDTFYPGKEFYFFDDLARHFAKRRGAVGNKALYEALHSFCREQLSDAGVRPHLAYDYCLRHRDSLSFMQVWPHFKEQTFEFLKNPAHIEQYFAHYAGEKPVSLYKKLRFAVIGERVLAFDYSGRATGIDVTEAFARETQHKMQ